MNNLIILMVLMLILLMVPTQLSAKTNTSEDSKMLLNMGFSYAPSALAGNTNSFLIGMYYQHTWKTFPIGFYFEGAGWYPILIDVGTDPFHFSWWVNTYEEIKQGEEKRTITLGITFPFEKLSTNRIFFNVGYTKVYVYEVWTRRSSGYSTVSDMYLSRSRDFIKHEDARSAFDASVTYLWLKPNPYLGFNIITNVGFNTFAGFKASIGFSIYYLN